jgi:hypothetical protein
VPLDPELRDRLVLLDEVFARDGLDGAIPELSYPLSTLRGNAAALRGALAGLDRPTRREAMSALSPYTRLALTAACADETRRLAGKRDWAAYLEALAGRVARRRPAVVTWLLWWIAKHLVEEGALDGAATVLALAQRHAAPPLEVFTLACFVADRRGDHAALAAIADDGLARAAALAPDTRSRLGETDLAETLEASRLYAAQQLGRADVIDEIVARRIAAPPIDELLALDVVHALVTGGRAADAVAVLRGYRAARRDWTPRLAANAVAAADAAGDGADLVDEIVALIRDGRLDGSFPALADNLNRRTAP